MSRWAEPLHPLTQPVIFFLLQNSTSLQHPSSYIGFACSCMLTVPADEVNTMRLTVFAFRHDLMMFSIPSTAGLITSFCNNRTVDKSSRESNIYTREGILFSISCYENSRRGLPVPLLLQQENQTYSRCPKRIRSHASRNPCTTCPLCRQVSSFQAGSTFPQSLRNDRTMVPE